MFILGVPLLIFPFAIYNIVGFVMPDAAWNNAIVTLPLPSGGQCAVNGSDLIIAGSIGILLIEMLKSARMSRRTIIDHLLSMVLFVAVLIEFLVVKFAATSTFLLLLVISFVDVAGGFTISIRASQRDISFSGPDGHV